MKALLSKIEALWGIKKEFRLKVLFLTLAFASLTACQAIWRPLKTTVFITMIGAKSIPKAKLFLMLPLIVLIIIYSKMVDWLRRHHLFYWFTFAHAAVGIILYFFLSHPAYGIANTVQSSSRILGWAFYLFLESFGAFMSAVFWSFANSVNKPKDAKRYYSIFVSGSKIGGIAACGFLYYIATATTIPDSVFIPNFVLLGCALLLVAAGCIHMLMKYVPGYLMHGYEAAYQYEKKKETEEKKGLWEWLKNGFEGLSIIIKNSYVFGILTIILSYEVIIVVFDYLLALAASNKHSTAGGLAGFYALYQLFMHSIGLIIALFGTAPIQRFLGIRLSLFACPIFSVIIILLIGFFPSASTLFYAVVVLRALNYGLNHPTREALFIPTTKAIKFKAKAWTDAFGSRLSKATGSFFNLYILRGIMLTSTTFTFGITFMWIAVTFFLGKTFQQAVSNNKVIGAEEETEEV